MKNSHRTNSFPATLPLLAAITLCFFTVQVASAGSRTWSGGGGDENWSNPANWDVVPVADDSLDFTGSTGTSPTNDFAAGTIFDNLTFDGSASSFTLNGNGLTLNTFTNGNVATGTLPIGGGITNLSGSTETANLPILLSAGLHTLTTSGGGQLNLSGVVTRNPGATVIFNASSGNINVTGGLSTNGFNNILGGWATFGTGWASLDANSNIVSFSSYTPISAGLIANGPANNLLYSSDSANLISATGTTINSIIAQQGVARFLTNTGILKLGSQGGIFRNGSAVGGFTVNGAGTLTASGGGEITLSDGPFNATANNLTISCVISNDGVNAVAVNVLGYVAFGAGAGVANTYSGGTFINQGRVQITPTNGFGTGPVYVFPGGEILFNSNGSYTNSFFIGGIGTTESAGLGAFRLGGASRVITGPVTLMGDATIGNNGQILGPILGAGNLSIGHGSSANGHGSVHVGGSIANSYTGDTIINGSASQAADTLFITAGFNNIMPHGAGKGNVMLNAGSATATAIFDLDGTTQTINGLTNSSTSPANNFVTSGSGGVLILGDNNTTMTYAGLIQNSLAITKIGNGTQTFTGITTNTGNLTVGAGTLVYSGTATPANSANILVTNSGTLDVSALITQVTATNNLSLSNGILAVTIPASPITNFVVNTLNLGGATNTINLASLPVVTSYPQTFHIIKYSALNGIPNLGAIFPSSTPPFVGYLTNNAVTSTIDLVLTGGPFPVRALTWTGTDGGNPSAWDVATSLNWKDIHGTATIYNQLDFTTFDDSAPGSTTVNLTTALTPSSVTVSNNSKTYTFSGSGSLGGSWTLNKQGSGLLIMDNGSANGFLGATISGGTVQVGNNDSSGDLGSGPIINNGTLVFDRTDNPVVVTNPISGSGGITQSGTGLLLVSNNNTFNGAVTITQGVLQVGTGTSLGNSNASLTIASGGTLDLNGNNLGSKPIFVSGSGANGTGLGAIDNTGLNVFPAVAFVTLLGDTTFGTSGGVGGSTTKGRWDLRAAGGDTANPTNAMLSTGGHPYNLTITGGALLDIVSATVDTSLANIDIQGGKLGYEGGTTGLGDPSKTITIENTAFLFFFASSNALNKNILINNGGTVQNNNSANTIVGPITLNTNADGSQSFGQFQVDGVTTLNLNGPITGGGTLYKNTGTGTLNLNGTNTFTGQILQASTGTLNINSDSSAVTNSTLLTSGSLRLNGLLGGLLGANGGTSVSGSGTNFGLVDISGNFLPGGTNAAGTFTSYGGFVLEGSANAYFDLSDSNTIGGGNDLLQVTGDLTLNGGNINISPFGLLANGVPYRLINYTGNLIVTGTPSVPDAAGYTFALDTNTPGQINVIASGGPPVWNGGSATDSDWSDAANFNGVSVSGGSLLYFLGPNRLNNTNDTTTDTTYGNLVFPPGAGAFTLHGNPLTPGGGIMNNSTNAQTIDLGLDLTASVTLSGGPSASSPLIIGGGLTNISGSFGTITLAGNGILTNLLASTPSTGTNTVFMSNIVANWTLVDNAASTPITVPWGFSIFSGTFNFGTPTSAPTLVSTEAQGAPSDNIVGQGAGTFGTFNMVNGNLTLTARLDTGASVSGATGVVNQVGGVLTVNGQFQGANIAGGVSTLSVSGGTLNIPGGTTFVASRGHGSLNVSGSAAVNLTTLDVSRGIGDGTVGVVNLNGGVLSVNNINTATANTAAPTTDDTGTFNFNGGILKALQNNPAFIADSSTAPVPLALIDKAGGAIIDDGGFAVTVLESLQHDATLGAGLDGGLVKQGAGTLTLNLANTYNGNTMVNGGTLAITGSLGTGAVTVNTNGNLSGTGSVGGSVTVTNGGTLSPGGASSIGTLTVAGSVTNLAGATNRFLLARGSSPSNSVLTSTGGTITYAGTLLITNSGTLLVAGDSFKLFNAGSYSGSFASIVPAAPGASLAWNTTNLAVNGTLSVLAVPALPARIGTITISGTSLTITGTGGAHNGTFHVVTSPTLTAPVSTWAPFGTGSFDASGNFTFNGTINPADGQRFYALVSP